MRNLKNKISLAILLLINFIFCYKYSLRYTDFGFYLASILLLFQFLVFVLGHKLNWSSRLKNGLGLMTIFMIIFLIVMAHYKIPLEELKVDRWSVIASFLTELYQGNYPYYAKSHMNNYPGPMPIYFLIAAPFYALGELSILSSLGYIIIVAILLNKKNEINNYTFFIFYILTSVFLFWEITTRSNIFTYTVIALLVLNEFTKLQFKSKAKFIGLAILTGLALSTRSIYILPYIVFFLSSLKNKEINFKNFLIFISIAMVSFLGTFIPFIWYFKDDFFVMNPFIVQSSFLVPKFYTVVFVVFSIVLSFLVKTKSDKYFYSGMSLFISILIYSLYHLFKSGFENSFHNSLVDISYFIFCVPFFMKYLLNSCSFSKDFKY